ncbi:UNVERIFIED_CONTAM: hypothetical protein Scaly_2960100 [Sesamum calycinum]|uniref:Uncharacterized protein n=1 Tax=Sesamum calycinum TaxID=2727403 RepID=A0AAW2KR38_9LAMI
MTWHANHYTEEGYMRHLSDVDAWRYLTGHILILRQSPRNVRLDLCTNGFVPHGQYWHTYSCWPVILTPYNLPPRMCMSYEYMFLTMVIYGPSNSKRLIDVYLEPLIEEL